MADFDLAQLELFIKKTQDRLDMLKAMRDFAVEDPSLFSELSAQSRSPEANGKIISHPAGREPGDNPFQLHLKADKILKFMMTKPPEEWVRSFAIQEGTGLKMVDVYTHVKTGLFPFLDTRKEGKKTKLWRLKPEMRAKCEAAAKKT